MSKSISINTASIKKFAGSLSRYQIIVYFLVLSGFVAVTIILILTIFTAKPENPPSATAPLVSNDNKKTVDKLQSLHSSENLEDIPAPQGRFSPFFESKWRTDIMEK